MRMRTMGLDVGDKRIGVALSDESAILASPRETITRRGNAADIRKLLELAQQEDVAEILVGMPLSLNGTEGPQAHKVTRFIEALRAETELPIRTWDERLSTVAAERSLLEADLSRAKRRKLVDKVAAAIILQSYLDSRRESGSP